MADVVKEQSMPPEQPVDRKYREVAKVLVVNRIELALFDQVPQMSEYLDSPNVKRDAKLDLLKKAFGTPWSDYFARFIDLVVRKGRQEILPYANEAYVRYWDEYRNRMDVTVTSAVELTGEQVEAISAKLSDRTGKNVTLQCQVDPAIIGGIRMQIVAP